MASDDDRQTSAALRRCSESKLKSAFRLIPLLASQRAIANQNLSWMVGRSFRSYIPAIVSPTGVDCVANSGRNLRKRPTGNAHLGRLLRCRPRRGGGSRRAVRHDRRVRGEAAVGARSEETRSGYGVWPSRSHILRARARRRRVADAPRSPNENTPTGEVTVRGRPPVRMGGVL